MALLLVRAFPRFESYRLIYRGLHPEERAPKSGLPDFGNIKVSKSATADCDARVSKDGYKRDRARRPSFETALRAS
jgi:hypothetical protein